MVYIDTTLSFIVPITRALKQVTIYFSNGVGQLLELGHHFKCCLGMMICILLYVIFCPGLSHLILYKIKCYAVLFSRQVLNKILETSKKKCDILLIYYILSLLYYQKLYQNTITFCKHIQNLCVLLYGINNFCGEGKQMGFSPPAFHTYDY